MRQFLALIAVGLIAGCGDPLVELDEAAALSPADVAGAEKPPEDLNTAELTAPPSAAEVPVIEGQTASVNQPQQEGGLLALLRRTRANMAQAAAEVEAEQTQLAALADTQAPSLVSLAVPEAADNEPTKPQGGGGWRLFGGRPAAPTLSDVAMGTKLPFGTVARVCEARGKDLGTKVEKGPKRGFALYDTMPGSSTLRTFYLTGFTDGCPRQLTAVNVLIGAPSLYDLLHYGPAAADLPYGETDKAYEKVKARVCGVPRQAPCGAKTKQLERSTVFVNAYDSFGNMSRWSEMLIHQGQVVAQGMKTTE